MNNQNMYKMNFVASFNLGFSFSHRLVFYSSFHFFQNKNKSILNIKLEKQDETTFV
jgi:hypothetical protein